jgi:uncharacterized membrane protein YeaQ/YmgE (transglycosylase-associated protein family)
VKRARRGSFVSEMLLGVLIAFVAYLLINGFSLDFDLSQLVNAAFISVVITSVLTFLVNKRLWKNKFTRWVLGIDTPVIAGRWEGYIKSSYDNFLRRHPVVVEIHQTNQETRLTYFDNRSTSKSLSADFEIEEGAPPKFMCIYRNEPVKAERDLQIHHGTMILIINQAKREMDGTYFNHQQQRRTYGQIHLRLQGKRLIHGFRTRSNAP